jgi:hypothetical protein
MTVRLHDDLSSGNGYKARLLLTQLGIPFERVEYDIDEGETRTPGFLENVNPNGRIPVLETEDGQFLPESNAILFYLADGTPFLSDNRFERARTPPGPHCPAVLERQAVATVDITAARHLHSIALRSLTRTRVLRSMVVPAPSSPSLLSPQAHTVPSFSFTAVSFSSPYGLDAERSLARGASLRRLL